MRVAGTKRRSWMGRKRTGVSLGLDEESRLDSLNPSHDPSPLNEAIEDEASSGFELSGNPTQNRSAIMNTGLTSTSRLALSPPAVVVHSPIRTPPIPPSSFSRSRRATMESEADFTEEETEPENSDAEEEETVEGGEGTRETFQDPHKTPQPVTRKLEEPKTKRNLRIDSTADGVLSEALDEVNTRSNSPTHNTLSSPAAPITLVVDDTDAEIAPDETESLAETEMEVGAGSSAELVQSIGFRSFRNRKDSQNRVRSESDSNSSSMSFPAGTNMRERDSKETRMDDLKSANHVPDMSSSSLMRRERRRVTMKGKYLPELEPASVRLGAIKEREGSEEGEEAEKLDTFPPIPRPRLPSEASAMLRSQTSTDSLRPNGDAAEGSYIRTRSYSDEKKADMDDKFLARSRLRKKGSAPLLNGSHVSSEDRSGNSKASTLPLISPPEKQGIIFPSRADFTVSHRLRPPPKVSLLSTLLSSHSSTSSNPFSALYAALGTKAGDALKLNLYFPHSEDSSKPLKVGVRNDATVEEVIGFGLWTYWEESRKPRLDVDEDGEDGIEVESAKWNLMMVEDDGEVDEDFPPFDRTRPISKVAFNEFAIVKATPAQVKDNLAKQGQIVRRTTPHRPGPTPHRSTNGSGVLAPSGTNSRNMSTTTISVQPSTASARRPSKDGRRDDELTQTVLLKVRIPKDAKKDQEVEVTTTLAVVPGDYIADVLTLACKKQNLRDPKEWAFVVMDGTRQIVVPPERTVAALGDSLTLDLVKRTTIASPLDRKVGAIQNVNPSASIFKRLSEPPQPKYVSAADLTSTYKKYTVYRKMPMPLGRHERVLSIDGDYIHIMPSESKGVFDGGRIASYHIKNISECRRSKRAPASIRLVVWKDRETKRYDFEAESSKQAIEIITNINALMHSKAA
ncbi:SIN1-domain-containing protein [Atractiella rhizophila]|nr:SIN1-domain-containing protein [Atractiella rhizophila]